MYYPKRSGLTAAQCMRVRCYSLRFGINYRLHVRRATKEEVIAFHSYRFGAGLDGIIKTESDRNRVNAANLSATYVLLNYYNEACDGHCAATDNLNIPPAYKVN